MWRSRTQKQARSARGLVLVALLSLGLGLTATGTAAAAPLATRAPAVSVKTASLKAVLSLSTTSIETGHRVTASVAKSKVPKGDKLTKITLSWGDGSKAVTLASLKSKPSHRYSKAGSFTVRLTLTDRHKKTAHAAVTEHVTVAQLASPGSYSGTTSQGYGLTFYVSAYGASLQDIVIPAVYLTCTPGDSQPDDELTIASAAIGSGGSFTGSASRTGVWEGNPATFSDSFKGSFSDTGAAGTFEVTVSYNNGTAYTCTSNSLSWSATRDTQPAQTSAAPPAGSYSGTSWQGYGVTFYVSSDGTSLQDIAVPAVYLDCAPGNAGPDSELTIASAAIGTGGSFTGTGSQSGVWEGFPATFSYNFRGNFHSLNASGVERAAGTLEETVSYTNGVAYTCTSNVMSWSATRATQPAQTSAVPPAGSYSGTSWQGYGLTFYVSSDGTSLQDIAVPAVYLDCAPGNAGPDSELIIASAAIGTGGSFTGTGSQSGIWEGFPATFSYTFDGNFHSLNASGVERAAGTLEETVSYSNATAYMCTSNIMTWSATRATQPAQTSAAPPAGSYSGTTWQGYGLTFSVSSDQATLENITIPAVYLDCTPGDTEPSAELTIPSAAIGSDGSFSGSATDTGVFSGQPATFSYTFDGNFHSLNASGAERAAGTFEVTVTYTNGTAYTCSSNQQSWNATFSSS